MRVTQSIHPPINKMPERSARVVWNLYSAKGLTKNNVVGVIGASSEKERIE